MENSEIPGTEPGQSNLFSGKNVMLPTYPPPPPCQHPPWVAGSFMAKLGHFVIYTSLSSRPSLLPQRPGVKEREWYPSLMSKGHKFQQVHLSASRRWCWHLEILSWDRNHDVCWFPLELSCAMLVIYLYLILSVGQICLQMQTGRSFSLKNK